MAKQSNYFECQNCQHQSPKWQGCCPECRKWNTLEEVSHLPSQPKTSTPGKVTKLQSLDEISTQEQARFIANISEWDRVTGNGIVPGSFSIVTGDP